MILNQRIYEGIRWCVSIVLPAASVFFATLADAWGWNLPTEAIVTSISALSLFLGTIFGISKLSYDKQQAIYAKGQAELDELNSESKKGTSKKTATKTAKVKKS